MYIYLCVYFQTTKFIYFNVCFIGCLRIVRVDHDRKFCCGQSTHTGFQMNHLDDLAGSKSFIYGPSTANIVSYIDALCITLMSSWC